MVKTQSISVTLLSRQQQETGIGKTESVEPSCYLPLIGMLAEKQ